MIKTTVILFFCFIGIVLHAQNERPVIPIDEQTQKIKFKEVVDEEGTKDELFNRCVYWLNSFYKDPTRVTTIRDLPTGKIAGRHQFRIYYYAEDSVKMRAGLVRYNFTIEFKDNRYRYTIDEMVLKSTTNLPLEKWLDQDDPAYDPRWEQYLRQVVGYVDNWSTTLKEKMKPEKKKEEDDW
jgi:hypothetical protein